MAGYDHLCGVRDSAAWADAFAQAIALPDPDPGCGPVHFEQQPYWLERDLAEAVRPWFAAAIHTATTEPRGGDTAAHIAESDHLLYSLTPASLSEPAGGGPVVTVPAALLARYQAAQDEFWAVQALLVDIAERAGL